jgi:hypothetical protein
VVSRSAADRNCDDYCFKIGKLGRDVKDYEGSRVAKPNATWCGDHTFALTKSYGRQARISRIYLSLLTPTRSSTIRSFKRRIGLGRPDKNSYYVATLRRPDENFNKAATFAFLHTIKTLSYIKNTSHPERRGFVQPSGVLVHNLKPPIQYKNLFIQYYFPVKMPVNASFFKLFMTFSLLFERKNDPF